MVFHISISFTELLQNFMQPFITIHSFKLSQMSHRHLIHTIFFNVQMEPLKRGMEVSWPKEPKDSSLLHIEIAKIKWKQICNTYWKTREFQMQLLHYFSKNDNKSTHHRYLELSSSNRLVLQVLEYLVSWSILSIWTFASAAFRFAHPFLGHDALEKPTIP